MDFQIQMYYEQNNKKIHVVDSITKLNIVQIISETIRHESPNKAKGTYDSQYLYVLLMPMYLHGHAIGEAED